MRNSRAQVVDCILILLAICETQRVVVHIKKKQIM